MSVQHVTMRTLPALTGVRGAAAISVILFHSTGAIYHGTGWSNIAILEMGWFGVDIFFLLSGFILSHVHFVDFVRLDGEAVKSFLLLRLTRIYPVHIFSLGVVVVFFLVTLVIGVPLDGRPRFAFDLLVPNLLLIQAWGWAPSASWNVVAWSISVEWAMYLLFPLVAFALCRLRWGITAVLCAGGCLALLVAALIALGLEDTDTTYKWGVLRAAGGFVAGCFLYVAYSSGKLSDGPWYFVELLSVVWLAIALLWFRSSFVALPAAATLILALAFGAGPVSAFLSTRALVYLGEISYSLYMMHHVTLETIFLPLTHTRLGTSLAGPLWLALYAVAMLAVFLVTRWTYLHVEKPSRLRLRQLLGR